LWVTGAHHSLIEAPLVGPRRANILNASGQLFELSDFSLGAFLGTLVPALSAQAQASTGTNSHVAACFRFDAHAVGALLCGRADAANAPAPIGAAALSGALRGAEGDTCAILAGPADGADAARSAAAITATLLCLAVGRAGAGAGQGEGTAWIRAYAAATVIACVEPSASCRAAVCYNHRTSQTNSALAAIAAPGARDVATA
jgi:hypothetical protein